MAEIKVERKAQMPIWPWIIGILVLLGLIWFLVEAFNEESEIENEFREVEVEGRQTFVPFNNYKTMFLSFADFTATSQIA